MWHITPTPPCDPFQTGRVSANRATRHRTAHPTPLVARIMLAAIPTFQATPLAVASTRTNAQLLRTARKAHACRLSPENISKANSALSPTSVHLDSSKYYCCYHSRRPWLYRYLCDSCRGNTCYKGGPEHTNDVCTFDYQCPTKYR